MPRCHRPLALPLRIAYDQSTSIMRPSLGTRQMQIRPCEAQDIDAVVRLSLRAWAPVFPSIEAAMSPELYAHFYPDWRVSQSKAVEAVCTEEQTKVWVAVVEGASVGFVAVRSHPEQLGEIYMIAVDPDYQRRGIATA